MRELLKSFDKFTIVSIPCNQNSEADVLANVTSKLIHSNDLLTTSFSIQLLFRPSIPDDITNFRVFNDDEQVINFLTPQYTFKESTIDDHEHDEQINNQNMKDSQQEKVKENFLPNSVVRLEKLFDFQDRFRKPTN